MENHSINQQCAIAFQLAPKDYRDRDKWPIQLICGIDWPLLFQHFGLIEDIAEFDRATFCFLGKGLTWQEVSPWQMDIN